VSQYIPNVIENEVGLSPFLSKLIAACNGTEYFLASWIAVFTIEKIGRRKLMLFGAATQSICMVCLAACDSQALKGNTAAGYAEVVFLFLFNTCFASECFNLMSCNMTNITAVGWLGMTWLYPAEIVPLKIRAPANAVSTTANWAFNFMVVMIVSRRHAQRYMIGMLTGDQTPVAFESISYQTYIIFAVINAFIFPVVYYFYPETAYRSLEEMDAIFVKTKSIFTAVRVAKEEPRRYGKNGEVLINYDQTDMAHRRRSSVADVRQHRFEKHGGPENEDV